MWLATMLYGGAMIVTDRVAGGALDLVVGVVEHRTF